jgi:hypothetical protein
MDVIAAGGSPRQSKSAPRWSCSRPDGKLDDARYRQGVVAIADMIIPLARPVEQSSHSLARFCQRPVGRPAAKPSPSGFPAR